MSRDAFEKAVDLVLEIEGVYSNDPDDPGRETKYGISKAAHPDVDIPSLTLEGAKGIYRRCYWDQFSCGTLPWPLAFLLFDCVVQFNPVHPTRWLQSALGVTIDGVLGPKTFAAARACKDPVTAATQVMVYRGEYRLTHPKYWKYGRGWRKRDLVVLCEAVCYRAPAGWTHA